MDHVVEGQEDRHGAVLASHRGRVGQRPLNEAVGGEPEPTVGLEPGHPCLHSQGAEQGAAAVEGNRDPVVGQGVHARLLDEGLQAGIGNGDLATRRSSGCVTRRATSRRGPSVMKTASGWNMRARSLSIASCWSNEKPATPKFSTS